MKKVFRSTIFIILAIFTVGLASCSFGKVSVTFNQNYDGAKSIVEKVKKGTTVNKPSNPSRSDGYHQFEGWFLNLEDETPFDFATVIEENITLYAKWKEVAGEADLKLSVANQPSQDEDKVVLEYEELKFQYSKVHETETGHVSFEHTGLLTNIIPLSNIKGIVVNYELLSASTKDTKLHLYYGNSLLPIYNETVVKNGEFMTISDEAKFFVLEALSTPFRLDDFYGKEEDKTIRFQLKEPAQPVIKIISVELFLDEAETEYVTPNLPKLYIDRFEDANGKIPPIANKEDYIPGLARLVDEDNEENNIGGEEGVDVGIRLRGNSTRGFDKKPYKIKFDKSQALFGLTKKKDWALLAEYLDGSSLHNYAALRMGQNLDSFAYTAAAIFIELYLEGEYQGLYLLNEHQEVNAGRVDIEQELTKELAFEDMNFMIELDRSASSVNNKDEVEGIDYFGIVVNPKDETYGTQYYSIKYPKKKDFEKAFGKGEETDQYYDDFFNFVKTYTEGLLDLFNDVEKTKDFENFSSKVDIQTLTDFFMIDFIMLETDHKFQSVKMHYIAEEDKLYFGPIWDYDSMVMGLSFEYYPVNYPFDKANDPKYVLPHNRKTVHNHFFLAFVNNYDGLTHLKNRYNEKGSQVLEDMITHLETVALPYIAQNLINDADKWYKSDLSIIFENIKFTTTYLKNRKVYLDGYLK